MEFIFNELKVSSSNDLVYFDCTLSTNLNCIEVSQFQQDNQINNASIGSKTTDFTVNFDPFRAQIFSSIIWTIDSDDFYSLNCN